MICGLCFSCRIAFLALQYGGFVARQRLAATGLLSECSLSLGAMHVVGSHHVNIALLRYRNLTEINSRSAISDFSAGARATHSVDQVSMFPSEATVKIKTIKQTMYCT